MARVRFGVALLIPAPWADEIDGLRRACGDRQLDRVPPHITLVPPVNVRADAVSDALGVLRAAAAGVRSLLLDLDIGPPASFFPESNTLYLAVGGEPGAMAALTDLRDAVFRGPLSRAVAWPFVPHVTIADDADPDRLDAAVGTLADYRVSVTFDRVHLLEERRGEEGIRRWIPVADAEFMPAAVVGRGGVELELTRSLLGDPDVVRFEEAQWSALDQTPPTPIDPPGAYPPGAEPVVITARRRHQIVGVARGWVRDDGGALVTMIVHEQMRSMGIGRQLTLAFESAQAEREIQGPGLLDARAAAARRRAR